MIFIKKTSRLFDRKNNKDKKRDAAELSEEKFESEEERQKAAILRVRQALGQDITAPIAGNPADEVWEPKTEDEIKQREAILKIRELKGEDTTVPIMVSDIKKLEVEMLEAQRREAGKEAARIAQEFADEKYVPQPSAGIETGTDEVWEPKTEEELRQHAAILKIRELLGEDAGIPIKKQQQLTKIVNSLPPEEPLAIRDPKAVIKLGEEDEKEVSSQYLLLKKLLEEDDTPKREIKNVNNGNKTAASIQAASSWSGGNSFTVGAILNAKVTKAPVKSVSREERAVRSLRHITGFSLFGGGSSFSISDLINAEPENTVRREEIKTKKEPRKAPEFSGVPKATAPNSPFFMVNFRDLTKD